MAIDAKQQGMLSLGIELGYSSTKEGSYTTLKNLQEIPDMGAEPETVETTTLADGAHIYIAGLKDYGSLAFTFLYDANQEGSSYKALRGLEEAGEVKFWEVKFPDGTKFHFSGTVNTMVSGVSFGDAINFTANIVCNSDIEVLFAD